MLLFISQESQAIAKMTTQCAQYMGAVKIFDSLQRCCKYQSHKYKYKYKYSGHKYKYKYKYFKMVLKYYSSTSTSTKYYISG